MSFLKNNPIPANPKIEFEYLSLFEAVQPDDIRGLSDAEATSLLEWLQERQQRYTAVKVQLARLYKPAGVAFFVFIIAMLLAMTVVVFQALPKGSFWYASVTVFMCLAAFLAFVIVGLNFFRELVRGRSIRFKTQADRLEPLKRSRDGCSEMLELVRAYPEISAYRNDVIGADRQLLQIDLEMAYELRDELDDAQVEAAQVEACRQLHAV